MKNVKALGSKGKLKEKPTSLSYTVFNMPLHIIPAITFIFLLKQILCIVDFFEISEKYIFEKFSNLYWTKKKGTVSEILKFLIMLIFFF